MRDREELTPLLVDEPMGGAVEGDEEAPTHAAPPPRILLVDDDEDDYIVTQELLRDTYGSAFKLDWCSTWEDALQAFSADGYDVFLLDQNLGAREGTDLVRTAVASGCNVPIILLTGNADRQLDLEAMRAGAADFLVKGQTSAVLMERSIRYALSQHGGHRRCKRQISWEAPSILLVDDDEDDYILARAMLFEIYGRHCKVD
ncbi:MAG TPA: response regulator, partial [Candidatus Defluviicoccus seviourii]|nr:response regulator [Candidatus Defluviicoccus seviourii]